MDDALRNTAQPTHDGDNQALLNEALATGVSADFIRALGVAAKAKGMASVADAVGVTRTSLYKSLAAEGVPSFTTVHNVIKALGYDLAIIGSDGIPPA